MAIKKIGVLGAGLMGAGIAQVAASSGYEVTVVEVSEELIKKGLSGIEKSLAKFVEKGAISARQKSGRSAGVRDVIRLPSTTTALSTHSAPAAFRSSRTAT